MVDPHDVIDESLPMLTEFLVAVGLHSGSGTIDYSTVLPAFSSWIAAQEISADDRFYIASRASAFISEYLIETASAERRIEGQKIQIRLPLKNGIVRDFDPFPLGLGVADKTLTLEEVIRNIS